MAKRFWPNGSSFRKPTVTRVYGYRSAIYSRGWHAGLDTIGHYYNHAPESGRVLFAAYNGSFGNEVWIAGDSGFVHRLAHHSTFLVRVGQRVAGGQRIGVQGATGMVTGVHCHWEVRKGSAGGNPVSPESWMAQAALTEVETFMSEKSYADAVWTKKMHGGGDLSTGGNIGYQTAAERQRQTARRAYVTDKNVKEILPLVRKMAEQMGIALEKFDALEETSSEALTAADVRAITEEVLLQAHTDGVASSELAEDLAELLSDVLKDLPDQTADAVRKKIIVD